VRVPEVTIERELQHAHARQLELITQRLYVGCDQPQILCDEGQPAEFLFGCAEEVLARARHPLPGLCRCRSSRYVPRRGKGAEMIQADDVHMSKQRSEPV
jgi:hypothetical protein